MQDNLREPAQQAAQSVRSSASRAFPVRDQGRSAAGQVQGETHAAVETFDSAEPVRAGRGRHR